MKKEDGFWVWAVFITIAVLAFITSVVLVRNAVINSNNSKIEIVQVNIGLEGTNLEEIKKGSKEIMYNGNELKIVDGDKEELLTDVEIGGRGNSSWDQVKKPFKIKLDGKKNLLGLGKSKKWALLANYFDDTHLRNEVAFEFWNMMNETIQMQEEPVELFVDGEYEGLYYLTRKIEISKDMVDVRDENGVIVELDNINSKNGECYYTKMENCLVVKDAVVEENKEAVMGNFLKKFNSFEEAAKEKNWGKLQEVCDIDSMAKYFLVAEFSANPDAYISSEYYYSDGVNDKLHAGPIWDYDFAFSNERWLWGEGISNSPESSLPRKKDAFGYNYYDRDKSEFRKIEPNMNISRTFYWMIEIPEFREAVKNVINYSLIGKRGEFIKKIVIRSKQIAAAARRNNEKWERNDYDEEVEKLIWWVFRRYDYIEREYGEKADV